MKSIIELKYPLSTKEILKPKQKVRVPHVEDYSIKVLATIDSTLNEEGNYTGEYRYKGMTYGVTIYNESLRDNPCNWGIHNMVPKLGFENSVQGDVCTICGKTN